MKKVNRKELILASSDAKSPLNKAEIRKFKALVHKTNVEHPKPKDMQALRKMLTETPNLWRAMGDLAKLSLKVALAGKWLNPSICVSIESGIDDLKKEFGYKDAQPIEKLLIDQIIVSWVWLQRSQMEYGAVCNESTSLSEVGYWEHRVAAAEDRFLRVCTALARLRKLAGPGVMQLNIGARQVNIAQAPTANDNPSEPSEIIEAEHPTLPG